MKRVLSVLCLFAIASSAVAQSSPGLVFGQVPTAPQWNSYFAGKMNYYPGGVPISQGGTGATDAATARLNLGISSPADLATAIPAAAVNKLYGGSTAAGQTSVVSIGSGLSLSGGTLTATGGSGTVTTFGMAAANGFVGSVSNATTTPSLTVSTSITGILKGNGTAIAAAGGADLPVMTSTVGGAVPTPPNNTTTFLRGDGTFATPPSSSGTVTTASVVSANGLSGSVATATTTPAITIIPTVTGIIKGTGSAFTTAANTDLPAATATAGGAVPTPPNDTTKFLRGDATWQVPPQSSGTVSTLSVTTGNGLSGIVTNPTTTPAIALSTSVNGIAKGNGTGFATATAGVDYSAGTSALATGIVKSTTSTGALSIATGGDLPPMTATVRGAVPNPPNDATKYLDGSGTWSVPPQSSGTVSTVAVATGNGFAGVVTNPTTTPSIAISTSVNGLLRGNGTTVSASSTTGSGSTVVQQTSPTITTPVITQIVPGADFTLSQNSVTPFVSVNTGAVANTLYLKTGQVGIAKTTPAAGRQLDVGAGSGQAIARVDGGSTGANAGAFWEVSLGGIFSHAFGNYSSILGGSYDSRGLLYSTGNLVLHPTTAATQIDGAIAAADSTGANSGQTLQIVNNRTSGTNYGAVIQASGTGAATNTGIYATASGGTSNYGLRVVGPGSGSSNYAIYSEAAAQNYFAGNVGIGNTSPARALDVTGTFGVTGAATVGGALGVTGNTTVGGTLGVTGATTTAGITNTGLVSSTTLQSSGNTTVGGNLGVTGTTAVNTLNASGNISAASYSGPITASNLNSGTGASANTFWAGDNTWKSTGTLTTLSVASSNGFSGAVTNPTSTPQITLGTTITGLLKGNGTALSAATAGTDYPGLASANAFSNSNNFAAGLSTTVDGTHYATFSGTSGIKLSTITSGTSAGFVLDTTSTDTTSPFQGYTATVTGNGGGDQLPVGAQINAYANAGSDFTNGAFGIATEAWTNIGIKGVLVGGESATISQTPSDYRKVGFNSVYKDRPDNHNSVTVPGGTLNSTTNRFNGNSIGILLSSQQRSISNGEYTGWSKGIVFDQYSLDLSYDSSGTLVSPAAIDFSQINSTAAAVTSVANFSSTNGIVRSGAIDTTTCTHGFKVRIDGVDYFVPICN